MEVNLDTLIAKIKTNGIEEAERKVKDATEQAEQQSKEIVAKANVLAKQIIDDAQKEAQTILTRGADGLKQAERDLLLTLEDKLKDMCKKYMSNISAKALDATQLVEILKVALSNWKFGSNDNIFVHLSASDAQKITKEVIAGAVQSQGASIEIKVDDSISTGFKISMGEGNFSFDFSADAISSALAVFLTPNIQELLK